MPEGSSSAAPVTIPAPMIFHQDLCEMDHNVVDHVIGFCLKNQKKTNCYPVFCTLSCLRKGPEKSRYIFA